MKRRPAGMMTAAIYARVSKKPRMQCPHCQKIIRVVEDRMLAHRNRDRLACPGSSLQVEASDNTGQDTENQLIELRAYCARQKWEALEYVDRESAKHGNRDEFKRIFEDASRRKFDVVVVWALDRFTREGVYETFDYVRRLTQYGVQFESYTEPHFRTTGPAGELMLAVAAWIAKQERLRISERTKAGLERARRNGRFGGRPPTIFRKDQAVELREIGMSWRKIAVKLDVPLGTLVGSVRQTYPDCP